RATTLPRHIRLMTEQSRRYAIREWRICKTMSAKAIHDDLFDEYAQTVAYRGRRKPDAAQNDHERAIRQEVNTLH
ncbi:MAG TPA: hypothetical protein VIT23_03210, partial [Terrimicrobiaceae bacterium]